MGVPAGPWHIDDLLTFTVNTHTVTTGIATDDDFSPTYRIYEDETDTPILTGTMAKLDDTNTTGFYSEQITLSLANGFDSNKCYAIYVAAQVASVAATTSFNFRIVPSLTANPIYDGKTLEQTIELMAAVLLGKASGLAGSTNVYRSMDDVKNRVTATVDSDGNRFTVIYDVS